MDWKLFDCFWGFIMKRTFNLSYSSVVSYSTAFECRMKTRGLFWQIFNARS